MAYSKRPITFIEGFSESLYKSMAIKAVRVGWIAGLEQAAKHLHPGVLVAVLDCQLFEDTFPTMEELPEAIAEIRRRDWRALCERETHHARGYTRGFVGSWYHPSTDAEDTKKKMWVKAAELGLAATPRLLGVLWCWLQVDPQDGGRKRSVDETPWRGMPTACADKHTREGNQMHVDRTIWSGHAPQHIEIERIVTTPGKGWEEVRRLGHAMGILRPATDEYGEILGSVGNVGATRSGNGAYQLTFDADGTPRESTDSQQRLQQGRSTTLRFER